MPEVQPSPDRDRGFSDFLAMWLGGLTGGVLGFEGGRYAAALILERLKPSSILAFFAWSWVIAGGLAVVGGAVGVWLSLRWLRRDRALSTALLFATVSLFVVPTTAGVGSALLPVAVDIVTVGYAIAAVVGSFLSTVVTRRLLPR